MGCVVAAAVCLWYVVVCVWWWCACGGVWCGGLGMGMGVGVGWWVVGGGWVPVDAFSRRDLTAAKRPSRPSSSKAFAGHSPAYAQGGVDLHFLAAGMAGQRHEQLDVWLGVVTLGCAV